MTPPPRPQSFALAIEWVAKITTVALEMVLPTVAGNYLDQRWGTRHWALAGLVMGMAVGFWHLMQMTRGKRKQSTGKPGTDRAGKESDGGR